MPATLRRRHRPVHLGDELGPREERHPVPEPMPQQPSPDVPATIAGRDDPFASFSAPLKLVEDVNDAGIKATRKKGPPKKPLPTPPWFARALKANAAATAIWKEFSPSARRDYLEWLIEAKTDETRTRRLKTAIEWIAEGKTRNWKYQK